MINASVSTVVFEWQKCTDDNFIMEVEPPAGELGKYIEIM